MKKRYSPICYDLVVCIESCPTACWVWRNKLIISRNKFKLEHCQYVRKWIAISDRLRIRTVENWSFQYSLFKWWRWSHVLGRVMALQNCADEQTQYNQVCYFHFALMNSVLSNYFSTQFYYILPAEYFHRVSSFLLSCMVIRLGNCFANIFDEFFLHFGVCGRIPPDIVIQLFLPRLYSLQRAYT